MTSLVPLYILIIYSFAVMVFNMKGAVSFGLFSGTFALTQDKLNQIPQQALLQDACPSDSILRDGECHLATTAPSEIQFKSNITTSLEEARLAASELADFPWTFWPECFSNEKTPEPYCVFSDQNFANGRGIFIVTTETLAYKMLQKPAFTNPQSIAGSNTRTPHSSNTNPSPKAADSSQTKPSSAATKSSPPPRSSSPTQKPTNSSKASAST
jgi:hypothetical protein